MTSSEELLNKIIKSLDLEIYKDSPLFETKVLTKLETLKNQAKVCMEMRSVIAKMMRF